MKIQQLLNYLQNPNPEDKEKLFSNLLKKEKPFFERYILNDLLNKGYIPLKQLDRINKKSLLSPSKSIFTNIYRLIYHPQILIRAYGNIAKNKGSLTPGIDKRTIDRFSISQIQSLHEQLKNKKYSPQPVRRVWVPKPNKPFPEFKRPLAIPTINDKIVQEATRMVLNIIYEPIFEELNSNFGFRPKKSPQDAINHLKLHINGYNYAIEGDIKGAYDNINQNTLINIISRTIKDKHLINLIKKMMEAGIVDEGKKLHSLTGVIQGSILSPLLFNIYLHEFDKYIHNDIQHFINIINIKQKRTKTGKQHNALGKIRYQLRKIKNKLKTITPNSIQYQVLKKEEKTLVVKRLHTPTIIPKTKNVKIRYCRYADDWVLFIDGPKQLPLLLKNKLQTWLKTYLSLELSEEKTLVTNVNKEWVHFLGFGIKISKSYKRIKKVTRNNVTTLSRTGVGNAIFTIDIPRLESRLRIKKFIHPTLRKSYHKPEWTIFEQHRILILYNQVLFGLFNYYKDSVNINNELYFIHYILKSSCAKTLASKYKTNTIKKIFKKFGPNLSVQIPHSKNTIEFPTFKSMMERKISRNYKPHVKDPLEITTNWRTRIKLLTYCVICSSSEKIEMHHIKRLRGPTGENVTKGFEKVMGAINRKQIPVCQKCHNKIHSGTYDNKSLNEIFTEITEKELLSL